MEGWLAIGAVLLGWILRVGIPIALTALLVWALRRLDARWQAEAEREVHQAPARLEIPCWVTRNCPEREREGCPAYRQHEIPCWQVFRDGNGRVPARCLDCEVFRTAPLPLAA